MMARVQRWLSEKETAMIMRVRRWLSKRVRAWFLARGILLVPVTRFSLVQENVREAMRVAHVSGSLNDGTTQPVFRRHARRKLDIALGAASEWLWIVERIIPVIPLRRLPLPPS